MVPKIKRDLARIYFFRGDWEKSVRNYGEIGNSDRSEMTALDFQRYAEALSISKRYGQAITNYRRVAKMVQDSPDRYPPQLLPETYVGMGECLYRENYFAEGLLMYQQALSGLHERRDLWWINSRIGQGYTRLNRLELGEKSFAEARAKTSPDDAFTVKMIEAWKEHSLWIGQNSKYVGLP
jgi:tetratricopeptide (TPR) repeat protein